MGPQEGTRLAQALAQHGITSETARAVEQLGRELRERTLGSGTECAGMLDAQTGELAGRILGGGARTVDVSEHLDAMVPGKGYIHVHTHPGSTAFSYNDGGILVEHRRILVMGVTGADGTWYLISQPAGAASLAGDQVTRVWRTAIAELQPKYEQAILEGRYTEAAAWREHTHEAWGLIARRLDLRYTRIEP